MMSLFIPMQTVRIEMDIRTHDHTGAHTHTHTQDEWEALQVIQHKDTLSKMEDELLEKTPLPDNVPLTDPKLKKLY